MAMTARGAQLMRGLAMNMSLLKEHEKTSPGEVDEILAAMLSHIRAWRPHALSLSLETGPVTRVAP